MQIHFKFLKKMALVAVVIGNGGSIGATAKINGTDKEVKSRSGSTFVINLERMPSVFDPTQTDEDEAERIFDFLCDSLLRRDSLTNKWLSGIAGRWELSADKKSYTFWIRPNIKFHNGQVLTAEDVKFSLDRILDRVKRFSLPQLTAFSESLQKIELVKADGIKITFKDANFKFFEFVSTIPIISKTAFQGRKLANVENADLKVCSGPYHFLPSKDKQKLFLEKFKEWYGYQDPIYKDHFPFENVVFHFWNNEKEILKHLQRGEIDYFKLGVEHLRKAEFREPNKKRKFQTLKNNNFSNKSYDMIALNLANPLFSDIYTRRALAMLMDRQRMLTQLENPLLMLAKGPFLGESELLPEIREEANFNVKEAELFLRKAGWHLGKDTTLLEKEIGGKTTPFSFSMLIPNKAMEHIFKLYQVQLKEVGIQLNLIYSNWSQFILLIEKGQYEAAYVAWNSAQGDANPITIWHSNPKFSQGRNIFGYKNINVDSLLEKAQQEFNYDERMEFIKKAYAEIINDVPALFLFSETGDYIAINKRIIVPQVVGTQDLGLLRWREL